MVVKNQGSKKEHHFAHYNGSGCDGGGGGESPAHSDTILFLLKTLREFLAENLEITFHLKCPSYDANKAIYARNYFGIKEFRIKIPNSNLFSGSSFFDSGTPAYEKTQLDYLTEKRYKYWTYSFFYNILKGIDSVEREYRIPNTLWRPDLALLSKGKVVRVIEVVYSHEDDPEKTKYYIENQIDVIRIDLPNQCDAFSVFKKRWDKDTLYHFYFNEIRCKIYRYDPCEIRISADDIQENWETRECLRTISRLLTKADGIYNELDIIEGKYADLIIEYREFLSEINSYYTIFYEIDLVKEEYADLIKDYSEFLTEIKSYSPAIPDCLIVMWQAEINGIKNEMESYRTELYSIKEDYIEFYVIVKFEIKECLTPKTWEFQYSIDRKYLNSRLLSRVRELIKKGELYIQDTNTDPDLLDVYRLKGGRGETSEEKMINTSMQI